MRELLGFQIDVWDYLTFLVLLLLVITFLSFIVWVAGLPGRIAIARKHPEAEAVKVMGYVGFAPVVPWIQALIWAFKPTDVVDIRRFPEEEAIRIEEEIARLSGTAAKPGTEPEAGRQAEVSSAPDPSSLPTDDEPES